MENGEEGSFSINEDEDEEEEEEKEVEQEEVNQIELFLENMQVFSNELTKINESKVFNERKFVLPHEVQTICLFYSISVYYYELMSQRAVHYSSFF